MRPDQLTDADPREIGSGEATVSPEDPADCSFDTESWESAGGEILVVRVAGELDLATQPHARAALDDALARSPRHLVVDLAGVTFCSVRGFALFAETGFAAAGRGIDLAFSGLSGHRRRVLTTAGFGAPEVGYPSVAAAVMAIRVADAVATR